MLDYKIYFRLIVSELNALVVPDGFSYCIDITTMFELEDDNHLLKRKIRT